jgi:hypothetical protein
MSSYQALVQAIDDCRREAHGGHLSLGRALDRLDTSAFCFITIVLVLPFLQPMSLGPLGVAGGLNFAALGWQLARGDHGPWLPARVRAIELSEANWDRLLAVSQRILGWCRAFTRPRLRSWVTGPLGRKLSGAVLIAGGLLMAVPFFGVPLNNALPGFAIFFAAVGELEEDGLMLVVAAGFLLVTVAYFALILYLILVVGDRSLELFYRFVPDWLALFRG